MKDRICGIILILLGLASMFLFINYRYTDLVTGFLISLSGASGSFAVFLLGAIWASQKS